LPNFPKRALERLKYVFIDPFGHSSFKLFRVSLPRILRHDRRRRRAVAHLDSFDRKLEHALGLVDILETPLTDRAYQERAACWKVVFGVDLAEQLPCRSEGLLILV
jgi:hypothetical protein